MNIERVSGIGNSILNVADTYNKQNISMSFSDILRDVMAETQALRQVDIRNNTMMAIRELENFHQPMIEMQKANLILQFTLQVRNKVLDAYQEIMRMQI